MKIALLKENILCVNQANLFVFSSKCLHDEAEARKVNNELFMRWPAASSVPYTMVLQNFSLDLAPASSLPVWTRLHSVRDYAVE